MNRNSSFKIEREKREWRRQGGGGKKIVVVVFSRLTFFFQKKKKTKKRVTVFRFCSLLTIYELTPFPS